MAYREFRNEAYYEAPDYSYISETADAISGVFRQIQQQQAERRKAADQFQYDLEEGAFETDTKVLMELAKNVTDRARQEIRTSGRPSAETEALMKQGKAWQRMSQNQLERTKALRTSILDKARADKYYNPDHDLQLLQKATHGEKNDIDFRKRGDLLAETESSIGGIDSFRYHQYLADYVKGQGTRYREQTSGTSEFKSTRYDQATFWDDATGKPGVTDDHAVRFLDSDERLVKYYDRQVNNQLQDEIKKMKASGDKRTEWMKGLSEEEIKAELINDPSKNLINQTDFGDRIRELAKADLTNQDRVNSKVSYEKKDGDTNNSGGRWKNKNILHTNSINSFAQAARSLSTGKEVTAITFGPGGRFTQKSGRPITLETSNPVRTDINTGVTRRDNKGTIRLNLTGYQLMPVKKGGAPLALKSGDIEGMIEEINNFPLEYFDPEGKIGLQPSLKIGLNGYSINEAGVLGDVNVQLEDVASRIATARENNDREALASLQDLEYELNQIKHMIGSEYNEQDLILAANKAGIRKVKEDYIIPADNSDIAAINNLTAGFNLNDKSFWSDEMQMLEEAYKKRYQEAKAAGFGKKKEGTSTAQITPDEFNKRWASLKPGEELIGPDGKTYVKQ